MKTLPISRPGAWVVIGAFGSAALTVVGFRLIGEMVGASAFGKVVLLYGVVLLVSNLCAGPVAQALGKYYFDARNELERGRWFLAGASMAAVLSGLSVGIVIALSYLGSLPRDVAVALLATAIVLEAARTICVVWLHSQQRFAVVAIAQLTDAAARPIGAVVLGGAAMSPANIVLLAYVLAGVSSVGLLAGGVISTLRWARPTREMMRRIMTFGAPLLSNSLFGWISSSGDRYIVAAALDVRSAGIYVAASALGGRLSLLLGSAFETYFRPMLYDAVSKRARALVEQTCRRWAAAIVISGAVLLIALMMAMQPIQKHLLATEFRNGSALVIVLSFVAYLVVALGFIPQRINYAHERTGYVATTEIAGTLFMGASVFALGARYGLAGAAAGMVLASVARLLVASLLASRAMRAELRRSK